MTSRNEGMVPSEGWSVTLERNVPALIELTPTGLTIIRDHGGEKEIIEYRRILKSGKCCCDLSSRFERNRDALRHLRKKASPHCSLCSPKTLEDPSSEQLLPIRLFYAIDCKNSSQIRTTRLSFNDIEDGENFMNCLSSRMSGLGDRPKRLLVFINPIGGCKGAESIYREQVAPIFKLCRIKCTLETTTAPEWCKRYIFNHDLTLYDGVVCVGGDGMANELINAVMLKESKASSPDTAKSVRAVMPIGIIPAGSTDALVCSTNGSHCAVNSALMIALGSRIEVDVGSIDSKDGKPQRYFAGFLSYGFFGNNVKTAEKYRWMGPLRYTWTGFQTFLANQTYSGRVTMEVVSESGSSSPCLQGCRKCAESSAGCKPREVKTEMVELDFKSLSCALIPNRCSKSKGGIAPLAHLADGCMDILVVEKCSGVDFLNFLIAVGGSSDKVPYNFDFVKMYKAVSMKFSPEVSKSGKSVWNCDGEVLSEHLELNVKVHRKAITLFASGLRRAGLDLTSDASTSIRRDIKLLQYFKTLFAKSWRQRSTKESPSGFKGPFGNRRLSCAPELTKVVRL